VIGAIYWVAIVAVVLTNLTALTLLAYRLIPFPAIARAAGLIAICLMAFWLEHLVGLGRLYVLSFPVTALSLYVIWEERERLRVESIRTDQIVFFCAVLFCFVWRLSNPNIVEDNDRLTDLHLVSNYLSGERLPPLDYWLPYQKLDYYYTFQHYSAALLGRLFGLGPGASFNLAAIILAALIIALAWELLAILRVRFGLKLIAIAALAIGGTGISPLFHFITDPDQADFFSAASARQAMYRNSRFVGWFETPVASDTWRALFGDQTRRALQLPIETFGYQFPLGGYHAVLSGFLLQFLALTTFVAHQQASPRDRSRLEFVLGLTVPLTLCASAWSLPLQVALVGAWAVWQRRLTGHWSLRNLSIGAATGTFLLLPFLGGLAAATGHMAMELVGKADHTPVAQFLVVFWPLLLLALLVPMAGRVNPLVGMLAAVFLGLLVWNEIFNAYDGGYQGEMRRFNSALKWWGWIFTGGVFSISAFLLASDRRAVRLVTVCILLLVSTFALDAGRALALRPFSGKLDGTSFYTKNPSNRRLISYLADAPKGIVLENLHSERPLDTGIYGSFAQKPNVIGIPWVLRVWKRNLKELRALESDVKSFYAGTHAQPARFLADNNVRYVVWSERESRDPERWQSIMQAIASEYRWVEFSRSPKSHIGLWVRR
jgi:hypothetical protein